MLDNPHQFIDAFLDAGADQITIHVEPDYPVLETLQKIRAAGCKCGVVLNPGTEAEAAVPISSCDIVLLMTVQPGFGGQSFREEVLPKMQQFDQWRTELGLNCLEVDGGVDLRTARCVPRGVVRWSPVPHFSKPTTARPLSTRQPHSLSNSPADGHAAPAGARRGRRTRVSSQRTAPRPGLNQHLPQGSTTIECPKYWTPPTPSPWSSCPH